MREKLRDKGRLLHIIEAVENIFEFTEKLSFNEFEKNKMLKFAVIKNLEIVGEASNLITKKLKEKHPEIEWQAIIGLRHVLVHGYYQISNRIIWNTIQNDLKPFKNKIKIILNEIK